MVNSSKFGLVEQRYILLHYYMNVKKKNNNKLYIFFIWHFVFANNYTAATTCSLLVTKKTQAQ
jgi:hypothetical protein